MSNDIKIPTRELMADSKGKLECIVTKIIAKLRISNELVYTSPWVVAVNYLCLGKKSDTELLFKTEAERDAVTIGYQFSNHCPGGN